MPIPTTDTVTDRRALGRNGIEVSPIALGCMSIVPSETYEGVDKRQAIATVHAALDSGINFFDNAPAYGGGAAEALLGEALQGRRDEAVIATKASGKTLSADEIERDCEASLERLRTDVIELYQIHWNRRAVPLDETLRAMEKLVEAGKVRALGVCNFGPKDLAEAMKVAPIVTNQLAYNLLFRAVEFEITPLCEQHGVGVLCYSPLAQGLLTGRYQTADEVPEGRARTRHFSGERPLARHGEAGCEEQAFEAIASVKAICEELGRPMADVSLAWLLHQPAVTAVLVGASRPKQVERNVSAGSLRLDPKTLARLAEATDSVKQALGPNADPWAAESRIQ